MLFEEELLISRPPAGSPRSGQPLVPARIAGIETRLVVDTGATETLVTRSLIAGAGIEIVAVDPGRDHAGATVQTWITVQSVDLEIGGHRFNVGRVSVVEPLRKFGAAGIGGILSPQCLDRQATLDLDLRAARMSLRRGALKPAVAMPGLIPLELTLQRAATDADELQDLILVEGAFEDAPPRIVMLNTGAWDSEFDASGGGGRYGRGLSGAVVRGSVRRGCFSVEGATLPQSDVVLRPQVAGIGGQIGMRHLGLTRLEIHRASGALRWWVPAAWCRWAGRSGGGGA